MKRVISKLREYQPRPVLLPSLALQSVTSRSGRGVYASSDTLFKGAVFGRDSLEVAEDLIKIRKRLVQRIIVTIASLQGEVSNDANEEESGKIIHEYRTPVVDGRPIYGTSRQIFDELTSKWGGSPKELAFYGSVDATPLFVRLVQAYSALYGTGILSTKVRLRSGETVTIQMTVERALAWIERKIDNSASGLLEYRRRNPQSFRNHVWKDSNEFYIHEDGTLVNHDKPVGSIEVQGLVYDALIAGAYLFEGRSQALTARASRVRDAMLKHMWLPERRYFALGIDYTESNKLRQIKTMCANAAELLDTGIFDALTEDERRQYIEAIVRTMFSQDFLTDAGIRSRALRESRLVPFWDYHGSFTTWPKETHDIARGLMRQGFPRLAEQLENRLLNAVMKSGRYPEFFYVDEWGRVLATKPRGHEHGTFMTIESTNSPEGIQAWTVSAVIEILSGRIPLIGVARRTRRKEYDYLETELLAYIPRVKRLRSVALRARYPTYEYHLVKEPVGERIKS
jgi:glycogen debranching enzyme